MVRLSSAYFDVLAAQDAPATAQASKKFISEQLASAKAISRWVPPPLADTREPRPAATTSPALRRSRPTTTARQAHGADLLVGRVGGVEPKPLATPVALPALASDRIDTWLATAEEAAPRHPQSTRGS